MMKTTRILCLLLAWWGVMHSTAAQDVEIFQQYFNQYASMLNTLSDVEGEDIEDRRMFKYRILKEYFDPEKSVISNHLPRGGSRDLLAKEYLDNLLVDYSRSIQHSIEVKGIIHTSLSKPIIHIEHRLSGPVNTTSDLQVVLDIKNYSESSLFATIRSISFYKAADRKELEDEEVMIEPSSYEHIPANRFAHLPDPIKDLLINKMVEVDGGRFTMGCTPEQGSDCDDDERPAHEVVLDDFWIGRYEVTVGEYLAFAEETDSHWPEWLEEYHLVPDIEKRYNDIGYSRSALDLPIAGVSWEDAQAFCAWLSEETGKDYRLPTEAEWEYAARGGRYRTNTKYAGSDELYEVGNYCDRKCYFDWKDEINNDGFTYVSPKGSFKNNKLGLYDMSGNVYEWCSNWYSEDYYNQSPQSDPKGPSSGRFRVLRGGSWGNFARYCRVSYRHHFNPDFRFYSTGFRLAL